jgi:hypothetical protein
MVQAGRSYGNSASEYNELKKQEKQLIQDIEQSKKRMGELQYVSGFMHEFRNCMLSNDIASVQRNCNGIIKKLSDNDLKSLLRTFLLSNNGTVSVSKLERDAYIALCKCLESGLNGPAEGIAKLKEVKTALIPYIPPEVVRQMNRHARTLARSAVSDSYLSRRIEELEVQCEQEKLRCASSPLHDRNELRKLTGELSMNRKKLELNEAARTFADCLTSSISDGKLLTDEKRELTKAQENYSRLQASVGILSNI